MTYLLYPFTSTVTAMLVYCRGILFSIFFFSALKQYAAGDDAAVVLSISPFDCRRIMTTLYYIMCSTKVCYCREAHRAVDLFLGWELEMRRIYLIRIRQVASWFNLIWRTNWRIHFFYLTYGVKGTNANSNPLNSITCFACTSFSLHRRRTRRFRVRLRVFDTQDQSVATISRIFDSE